MSVPDQDLLGESTGVKDGFKHSPLPSTKSELTTEQAPESALTPDKASQQYPHGIRLFLVVSALLLSMFLIALDMSVDNIGWYASAFFITLAVFQSAWGKAYQYFDLKLTFLLTIFLFEVGSLICGVAQNSITLIIGRAIAGLGGAGVTGGVYTIMAFTVPPPKVPKYLGLIGAVFSVASVAGPLLGGVFAGEATWRWCFYLNLPVGGVAMAILILFFQTPEAVKPIPVTVKELLVVMDIPGIVLCMGSLICLSLAMQWGGTSKPWSSPDVIGTLVGFAIMLVSFVVDQWYFGEKAMLVLRVFRHRTVLAVSIFIFFLNSANFLLIYNLPEYFQIVQGASAIDSGLQNLSLILSTALTTLISGYALGKVRIYPAFLITSAGFLTLGAGLIYTLDSGSSLGKIIGFQILVGVGVGMGIQVPVAAAQDAFVAGGSPADVPVATAVVLFFQLIAGAVFVAASQALLTTRMVATLATLAPGLAPSTVLGVGATEIRSVFSGSDLSNVVQAYMAGIKDSWAMSIGLAGVTFLIAFTGKWGKMHEAPAVSVA
ncbi:hypothetical protein N0V82_001972 [Gnomoniopsis sp. IMI 355080]|nr:hypothetical protein N0V82_001972 [Gnomoniopsis sp. IMI 355080]